MTRQAWDRFLAALEPLRAAGQPGAGQSGAGQPGAGKLGAILLQFPPWFPISRANKDYILACAQRAAPRRVCVEFRNHTWMTDDNQPETLRFLADHNLPYVCVDMPQGYPSSMTRSWPPPATWPWSACTAIPTNGRAR